MAIRRTVLAACMIGALIGSAAAAEALPSLNDPALAATDRRDPLPGPESPLWSEPGSFGLNRTASIDCLAKAIGYEAATEPEAGQQAVAQVVLNRVHHRAFPKTVCGVVYQGSERRTGCQFTFTCDGSLRRALSRRTWDQALRIAAEAIDGRLPATVGAATHYHADYVAPRWAPALVRIASIGAHIFYRFPAPGAGGGAGSALLPAALRSSPGLRPRDSAPPVFRVWGLTPAAVGAIAPAAAIANGE